MSIKKKRNKKREINGVIYKLTSPTGRIYIGQTIEPIIRFRAYRKMNPKHKTQDLLYKSLKKYTFDKHLVEFLEINVLPNLIDNREIYWIAEFKCNKTRYKDGIGLNLTDGGKGFNGSVKPYTNKPRLPKYGPIDIRTRSQKISDNMRGRINSIESNLKNSESNKIEVLNTHTGKITLGIKDTYYNENIQSIYNIGFGSFKNWLNGKSNNRSPFIKINDRAKPKKQAPEWYKEHQMKNRKCLINIVTNEKYYGVEETYDKLEIFKNYNIKLSTFKGWIYGSAQKSNKTNLRKEGFENVTYKDPNKTILNTETGETYNSLQEVADILNVTKRFLQRRLCGELKNKTKYKYV